jgi:hypothetical protein
MLAHGNHKAVVAGATDILPLKRSGGRQDDIGEFRLCGPVLLVDHNGFRRRQARTSLFRS